MPVSQALEFSLQSLSLVACSRPALVEAKSHTLIGRASLVATLFSVAWIEVVNKKLFKKTKLMIIKNKVTALA